MKKTGLLVIGWFISALVGWAQSATPLAANGQLRVVNRQLTNQSGKGIQLRGMSTHGLQWFDNCYSQASVRALASDWGTDVVRAAMYVDEGGYLTNQSGLRAKINQLVDWTNSAGVYCIIDWHILNPGNPNDRLSYAIDFFRTMAQTHAGKKNVIYEICNEPNGVSWDQIKTYADQVIPVIRQYDQEAIILVGTPNYCQRPQDVLSNPLTGANAYNVMYTFHFYAASHFFQSDIRSVVNSLPLFCSEWGTSTYSGGGSLDVTNGQNWLDLMAGQNPAGQKISWCNWTFSDAGESSAALNAGACAAQQWNNTSTSGTWVKGRLLNPADDFGPATPSVVLTSPAASTTVGIGTNLVINASVTSATATAVEFYNGTTLLGSDPTAPYSWTLANLQQGTYSLTAKALTNSGSLTSPAVGVTVAPVPNQPPAVALVTPADNAVYTAPAAVNLAASATDADGSVAKVEFFTGTTKLAEVTSAPYQYNWINVPVGTYALTARATDNKGATTTSGTVSVRVYSPGTTNPGADLIGPDCVLKNAVQVFEVNSSKLANATNFSWWSTGSTRSITGNQPGRATIDFGTSYSGGQVCVGVNYSVAPWYAQFCKDVAICAGTPPITTPANQPPSVGLTGPAATAAFTAPATISLAAAASDADGNVAKVEFFNGSTKLGESVSSPYTFVWTNVPAGSYTLTAKATDNAGAATTSGAVTIRVTNPQPANQLPTVALTAPTNTAAFTAPATVNLAANATDADGLVAKVEFFSGTTKLGEATSAPYTFVWTNVPAGSYTLTARATDNQGGAGTSGASTITVTAAPVAPPPATTADLIGPDCVAKNAVQQFEVSSSKMTSASSYSWWFTGSSQRITPTQPGKATFDFGPYVSGGQVCVGINYSAAPWYAQFCKTITVCSAGARVGSEPVGAPLVFPNPASQAFTVVADQDIQSIRVADQLGRERLLLGKAKAGQTLTFGSELTTGTYLMHIHYVAGGNRVVKLQKLAD